MTRAEWSERWKVQCAEWQRIKDEFIDAGKTPSAFDISLEQRKRALADGRRLVTYTDLVEATS